MFQEGIETVNYCIEHTKYKTHKIVWSFIKVIIKIIFIPYEILLDYLLRLIEYIDNYKLSKAKIKDIEMLKISETEEQILIDNIEEQKRELKRMEYLRDMGIEYNLSKWTGVVNTIAMYEYDLRELQLRGK